MCPLCTDDEEVYGVGKLDDGRKLVECRSCKHESTQSGRPSGTQSRSMIA